MNLHLRNSLSERHALLVYLQQLSVSDSAIEQQRLGKKIQKIAPFVLEECLPQIVHISIFHSNASVRELLQSITLSLVGSSLYAALRVSWAIISIYIPSECSDRVESIRQFQDSVESYAINQVTDVKGLCGSVSSKTELENTDECQAVQKELRLNIYNDEHCFVKMLTDISEQLRHLSIWKRRNAKLRKCLSHFNKRIQNMRLFHPLGSSADSVKWIVNIVVDECVVFSSRERAPYLIRYEVLVDDTATMQDPTRSQLRLPDGSFRINAASDQIFVPQNFPKCMSDSIPNIPLQASKTVCNGSTSKVSYPLESFDEFNKTLIKCFGENLQALKTRVRSTSRWGSHPNWDMYAAVVKAGDDLRQEELAMQLIYTIGKIWKECGLSCFVHPYRIMPTNVQCGLLEVVDAKSIDSIKKKCPNFSLNQIFDAAFGSSDSLSNRLAQRNFVESMAGYSVASYVLQLKDRHNGNLLLSRDGSLIHIDFGFFLMTSPGGLNFESAPFKLSQELIDIMGGQASDMYGYYKILVFQGLGAVRQFAEDIIALVSLMIPQTNLPCLAANPQVVVSKIGSRLRFNLISEVDYALYVSDLIASSADNWRTRRYDQFQTLQNGIW